MTGHLARARALVSAAPPILVVLAFLAYALTSPGLTRGHAAGVYATAAALVEQGHPAIDGAIAALAPVPVGADAAPATYGPLVYAAGRYYHDAPPGPALLATPAYALGLALAPWLGPDAPAVLVVLLGPLLGAFAVAALWRLASGLRDRDALALTAAGALLLWPFAGAPTAPLVAAALLAWLLPSVRALWAVGAAPPGPPDPGGEDAPAGSRPILPAQRVANLAPPRIGGAAGGAPFLPPGIGGAGGGRLYAFLAGTGLASLLLIDYVAGALACLALLTLLLRLRRRPWLALPLIIGAVLPALALTAWQTVTLGEPWRPAFRFAVDPAARSALAPLLDAGPVLLALAIPFAAFLAPSTFFRTDTVGPRARATRIALGAAVAVALTLGALAVAARRGEATYALDWRAPAAPVMLVAMSALLAAGFALTRGSPRAPARAAASRTLPLALLLIAGLALPIASCARAAGAPSQGASGGENYLAPFSLAPPSADPATQPLWKLGPEGLVEIQTGGEPMLRLAPRGSAISPWVDVTPGTAYRLTATTSGDVDVSFTWEDAVRQVVDQQSARRSASGHADVTFAAPPRAAGLRVGFSAGPGPGTVAAPRLALGAGTRVEPFPDYARAALAFSFDWESAMGGLIHSRASGDNQGEGAALALTPDGAPSVAEAEQRGLLMREGARFLADTFAGQGIRATFYATGYNLLDGNPGCRKFAGDPTYRNVDRAHGWGSDYWRTHRWYEHDPCSTEERAPAWYFASLTRELAAAGHEIASHTFGHLYVRGVSPDQLETDLDQWLQSARVLGVPVAPSFAFPWTSSNSLTPDFFAVFERLGLTVLTRLYPPPRHPFELDRVPTNPALAVFPDQYLPSTPDAERAAVAAIDEALARRGYLSLWAHPDEVMLQDGPAIWSRVVAHAAAQRERGLWIAPVAEIAQYSLTTRNVAVTALPIAGGWRLTVENRSSRPLDGLTLTLPVDTLHITIDGRPSTDTRAGQLRLPALAPGARATILARR